MTKACLLFTIALSAVAQTGTRGIVPEAVMQARPPKTADTAKPVSVAKPLMPRYEAIGSTASKPGNGRQIGVTIWKLRRSGVADDGARILVQEEAQSTSWTPERVSSTANLRAGDRVRLSIESPEPGYLYVIDREKYATGERGTPYLIFPTTRTRDGDNKVSGGRLTEIPAQTDRPSFFTLQAARADQAEEELTVLLTSKPLEGLEIGAKPLALFPEQVAAWEKQWSGSTQVFELAGSAGRTWTSSEQRAGADATRLLTQADPPPQTVYRVATGAEVPLLVKVRLRYQANSRGK